MCKTCVLIKLNIYGDVHDMVSVVVPLVSKPSISKQLNDVFPISRKGRLSDEVMVILNVDILYVKVKNPFINVFI
jgi:hypothetical protein